MKAARNGGLFIGLVAMYSLHESILQYGWAWTHPNTFPTTMIAWRSADSPLSL
jgi:hypothetical protein